MATYDYKKLNVWQRSMDLVVDVYGIIEKLPKEEKYALSDQMRRRAVSIPSNIAEGQKRSGLKETIQFTYIALGSLAELETQILLCARLYKVVSEKILTECEIIGRMLTALTTSLRAK